MGIHCRCNCVYGSSVRLFQFFRRLVPGFRRASAVPDRAHFFAGYHPCLSDADGGLCKQRCRPAGNEPHAMDSSCHHHSKCNRIYSLLPNEKSDTSRMPEVRYRGRSSSQFLPRLPLQLSSHMSAMPVNGPAGRYVLRKLRHADRSSGVIHSSAADNADDTDWLPATSVYICVIRGLRF